ncbi:hypothetical protein BG003_004133 [Podila horticola]|nr:hypothetical protein BG003_004133 [Podila horticola]
MSNHRVKSRGGSAQLDRILSNNSGLQELALYGLERLEVLEGSQPYTTLQLESDWTDNNTGMLHLLRRCPSLTALVFSVNRCPATELALSVKKYCPDLQTITGVGSSRYDASYVRGLTEIEHVELIESIRSLVHYTMLIDDLPLSVCRALVGHANALTSIDLTFKGHTIEGLANLETVLGACRSLNVLRLSNAFDTWNEVDGAVMLRGVWGCLHLQHIEICGFVRPASERRGCDMFLPQDLISCTLVSHTWRNVLLPVLWSVYDEAGAVRVTPLELHRNRHHIRYLHLNGSWPSGIHYPTNLRRLSINSSALLKSTALIQLNPQLTELVVTVDGHFKMATRATVAALEIPAEFADITDDDMDELEEDEEEKVQQEKVYTFSDLYLALETFSNLKSLHLCNSTRETDRLIKPPICLVHYEAVCSTVTPYLLTALLNHSASLQTISLFAVDGSVETFYTAGKILASFPNLRTFYMGLSPIKRYQDNSWAFFDQDWNCPRLEKISLMGYSPWFRESNERHVAEEADRVFKIPDRASGVETQAGEVVIPECHPATDKAFFESLAKVGWAYKKEIDSYGTKKDTISNGTRATRNKLFERLIHLQHMREIRLPYARYVKL